MYNHMPELFQVLKRLLAGSPVSPEIRLGIQRSFGCADHGCVNEPVSYNSMRKLRHRGTAKIVWDRMYGKLKSAMILNWYLIFAGDFVQYCSGGCSFKCGVYDKALDILSQVDGAMNLRFNA